MLLVYRPIGGRVAICTFLKSIRLDPTFIIIPSLMIVEFDEIFLFS